MADMQSILKFLSNLGLSFEESQAYLSLIEAGEQTILEISKSKDISRTTVYRIMERLQSLGLVEEIKQSNKRLWTPVSVGNLEILVKEQESKAQYLRSLLPELQTILPSVESLEQAGINVKIYKGRKGIEQLLWNQTKEKEIQGFASQNIFEITSKEFASKWTLETLMKKTTKRILVSDLYIQDYTKQSKHTDSRTLQIKTIPWRILDTAIQLDIYGNSIAFYRYHADEHIGIEIHNDRLVKMMRQLYTLTWER